jgi:hypothetical protein
MKRPRFELEFQKACEAATYELVEAKLAKGDAERAEQWLEDWRNQGGMRNTFARLIRQAEAADEEDQQLTPIDKVIIYSILVPMFDEWGNPLEMEDDGADDA